MSTHQTVVYTTGHSVRGRRTVGFHAACSCGWTHDRAKGGMTAGLAAAARHKRETPSVGDHVRDRHTHDAGIVESVVTTRNRTIIRVKMDRPDVALTDEWVALAENFEPVTPSTPPSTDEPLTKAKTNRIADGFHG